MAVTAKSPNAVSASITETLQHRQCSLRCLYGKAPILHCTGDSDPPQLKGDGNEDGRSGPEERRKPAGTLPAVGPGLRAPVRAARAGLSAGRRGSLSDLLRRLYVPIPIFAASGR